LLLAKGFKKVVTENMPNPVTQGLKKKGKSGPRTTDKLGVGNEKRNPNI